MKTRAVRKIREIPKLSVMTHVKDKLTKRVAQIVGRQANIYTIEFAGGETSLRKRDQIVRIMKS